MRYVSTRALHRFHTPEEGCSFTQAIEKGLAPDGGLYVPALDDLFWKRMASTVVPSCRDHVNDLPEIAARILAPFVCDGVEKSSPLDASLAANLEAVCRNALKFPTPLRFVDRDVAVLELFHGPTAAFKDVGASFLAECLAFIDSESRKSGKGPTKRTVIVATSGDTGGAVAAAFFGRPHTQVRILFPKGRVSARQQAQLCCWGGNVRATAVRGTFDDCQRMVKAALSDSVLCERLGLFSANSINIGRLLPQITYYAQASLNYQAARPGTRPGVIVPSGNLGNGVAAVLAMRMGFPIREVVFSTNANTAVVDYLRNGTDQPRSTIPTLANAMDVGIPSNLERLKALLPSRTNPHDPVRAISVSDDEIREEIRHSEKRWGTPICPHTATAFRALHELRTAGPAPESHWILAATAHPAKFESVVEPLIGHELSVPPALGELLAREQTCVEMDPVTHSDWL